MKRKKLVIKLANEGKMTRENAKEVHVSLKDFGEIIRMVIGDEEPDKGKKVELEKQQ